METPPVKFLVIRFSSIGDIVLTTPVVRGLKQQVEGAEVHFLTKKQYSGIVKTNPYVDKVIEYDGNFSLLIKDLRDEFYDYVIDLHHNLRTLRIKQKLGLPAFSFDKLNLKKWLLVNFNINKLPDVHIVDRYLQTVHLFDIQPDNKGLDYFIPEKDEVEISSLPEFCQNGYVGFVIGAQHFTKKMPAEKIKEICQKINYPILILGGKEDATIGEQIANGLENQVFNACGKYNLNQSASLVRQAQLIISHDTGLMHIAAAFDKIIFSLWGNTVPEFGMSPYLPQQQSEIFEVKGLKCRPCSKIGFSRCPKKHFRCMNEISSNEVANKVTQVLSQI